MLKLYFFLFLAIFLANEAWCQFEKVDSLRIQYDKMYGLDVLLQNGRKYFADSNPVKGHPFWISPDPFVAEIYISGKKYPDQSVRYDIYRQEFILVTDNFNGQKSQIVLNSLLIDSVKTENSLIIANTIPGIQQKFVQSVYSGKLSCYVGWFKTFQFYPNGANTGYVYSDDEKMYYLLIKGHLYPFNSRKSFLSIFSGDQKAKIRKYISVNRLKFAQLGLPDLRQLIVYCESIDL